MEKLRLEHSLQDQRQKSERDQFREEDTTSNEWAGHHEHVRFRHTQSTPFIRMTTFQDNEEELETHLQTFENLARDAQVEESRWALLLTTVMSAKAQRFINAMDEEDRADYSKVKEELLRRYEVTADRSVSYTHLTLPTTSRV